MIGFLTISIQSRLLPMYESGDKKKHVSFRLPHRKNEKNKKQKTKQLLRRKRRRRLDVMQRCVTKCPKLS